MASPENDDRAASITESCCIGYVAVTASLGLRGFSFRGLQKNNCKFHGVINLKPSVLKIEYFGTALTVLRSVLIWSMQRTLDQLFQRAKRDVVSCPICFDDIGWLKGDKRDVHVNRCMEENLGSDEHPVKMESKTFRDCEYTQTTMIKTEEVDTLLLPSPKKPKTVKIEKRVTKRKVREKKPIPPHKLLEFGEVLIAVDAFCYAHRDDVKYYVLTHFHSDHYGGLCKSWSGGKIICTPITSRLMQFTYKFPVENIIEIDPKGFVSIDNVQISFIDACHCPGAGVFIFEGVNRKVIHCGDFRASNQVIDKLIYQEWDTVYLDNTYDNPKYVFPPQESVIEECAEWIVTKCNEKPTQRRIGESEPQPYLVIVGTYGIGKEKLAIGVAKALKTKIFANEKKRQKLELYEWEELNDLLHDDPLECDVHIVSMNQTTIDGAKAYWKPLAKYYRGVISIHASGWDWGRGTPSSAKTRDPHVFKRTVPYSEHSSYDELTKFRSTIVAAKWINTVNFITPENSA